MADTNPYREAYDHTQEVRGFVIDSISDARLWAEQAQQNAAEVLADLADFVPSLNMSGTIPSRPELNIDIDGEFNLPEVQPVSFGQIGSPNIPGPALKTVRDAPDVSIDIPSPARPNIRIPEAPTPMSLGELPSAPSINDPSIPSAPDLDRPILPQLEQITLPQFDATKLPTWESQAPEFQGTAVSTVLQWSEKPYNTERLDDVVLKLRDIWAGGNGIPRQVEQALWKRAAEREDRGARQQLDDVAVDYSRRGFATPPGAQLAREDAIRTEVRLKKQSISRDVAIRMAELHIENTRWAAEQMVAADQVYFNIWNNMANRAFEAAKVQLDSMLALYNAQVSLFNARQSAYSTEAEVFRIRNSVVLDQLKTEIEAELAKGTTNEQVVRVFGERIKAMMADVDVYNAQLEGAKIKSGVNKDRIDRYRAEVAGFAEKVNIEKSRYDAYDSRVRGEMSKAQVFDSEARAFSSYISGQASLADIGIKRMEADIQQNAAALDEYRARLEHARAEILAQTETIKASADAYTANTQRYQAQASAEEARHRVELAGKEAEIRSSISMYEVEIRKYVADMESMIRKAEVQLESLKAAGQVSSTMAAGAMAGINIGANLSGSGNVSASGSKSQSDSNSSGLSYSVSVEADDGPKPTGWRTF